MKTILSAALLLGFCGLAGAADDKKPGPGVAALGTVNFGGPIMVAMNLYLYGDRASGTLTHETPLWEAWFQKRFPMPTEPGKSD